MIFTETKLKGAYIIDPEPIRDKRGFFARAWDKKQLDKYGLKSDFVQSNLSFNLKKGTLRGMHYQAAPHAEAKLVRCIKGAIYDVIIDLRKNSPTYKKWTGIELTDKSRKMLYVPEGFAHGYLTLTDNAEVLYMVTAFYEPKAANGVRWSDPAFGIKWPEKVNCISEKDAAIADYIETKYPRDKIQ